AGLLGFLGRLRPGRDDLAQVVIFAREGVAAGVDLHAKGAAGQGLDAAARTPTRSGWGAHGLERTPVQSICQSAWTLNQDHRTALTWEPPVGIEPTTCSLRVNRSGRLS